jgi:mersacidin/lichenicidin family type 2 lantibiotic
MDIIRAWKDEEYRNSLSEAERTALPENPAGFIALTDEDLGAVAGGRWNQSRITECVWDCFQ